MRLGSRNYRVSILLGLAPEVDVGGAKLFVYFFRKALREANSCSYEVVIPGQILGLGVVSLRNDVSLFPEIVLKVNEHGFSSFHIYEALGVFDDSW